MSQPAIDRRHDPPAISAPLLAFFQFIVRGYFRRHFHAVRLSGAQKARDIGGPLILYANHSSWWDPMVAYLLAEKLFPGRSHYAPMDASALARYPVLRRLGIFPVEMQTTRGAARFLRTGEAILHSGAVLWVTPQGQFADARERPLRFKPGLAALAARIGACTLLPLAIEYTFWDERLPEALLQLGDPVHATSADAGELEPRLTAALETTMDALREKATARSSSAFEQTLSYNSVGAGGFYAFGQRLKALALRQRYQPEHTPTRPSEAAPR